MTNLFGLGHIAQLHEIQAARLKRNQPGIGPEVEDLIARLRGGAIAGNQPDERTSQAKVLWDLGFGRELRYKTFEKYLATVPAQVPDNDRSDLFDRLVLVDRRLGIVKTSNLLGLAYHQDNETTLVSFYDRAYPDVEFVWCQDGRKNRGKSVRTCRERFVKDVEIGLTAIEGSCLYAQDRSVIDEPNNHTLYLPGSVSAGDSDCVACLYRDGNCKAWLGWGVGGSASPRCGSASRRA